MDNLARYIGLAFFLSACMTPQQRAERMELDYGPQCRKLGHSPGSEPYRRCLQSLHNVDVSEGLLHAMSL